MAIFSKALTSQTSMVGTTQPMIEALGVERSFAQGGRTVRALRGVDLRVNQGELVVLMGPSGSGKTTLLNIVGGLDQPTAGTVMLDGQHLAHSSDRQLTAIRRQIGFIFQSFALLPTASAYENVELGLRLTGSANRRDWDIRVRRSLHAVGLTPWLHHRPYELSGGQQQRVAIARALAIRPRVILADEPTGDLDSKTAQQVLQLFRALVDDEGMTILIATHDSAATKFATTVYQLHDGQFASVERAK